MAKRAFNLPNMLTYGRILAVPLVVLCFFLEGRLQSSDFARWSRASESWVATWVRASPAACSCSDLATIEVEDSSMPARRAGPVRVCSPMRSSACLAALPSAAPRVLRSLAFYFQS